MTVLTLLTLVVLPKTTVHIIQSIPSNTNQFFPVGDFLHTLTLDNSNYACQNVTTQNNEYSSPNIETISRKSKSHELCNSSTTLLTMKPAKFATSPGVFLCFRLFPITFLYI